MTRDADDPLFTPVTRVEVKRVNLAEMVNGDELLRGCKLLTSLPAAAVEGLLAGGVARRYANQARIFCQGDGSDSLFMVLRGELRLTCAKDTEAIELGAVQKGEVVGEEEILGGAGKRAYSAVAVGEVDLVEFGRPVVAALVTQHPPLERYFKKLKQERRAAQDEMAAFLKRW